MEPQWEGSEDLYRVNCTSTPGAQLWCTLLLHTPALLYNIIIIINFMCMSSTQITLITPCRYEISTGYPLSDCVNNRDFIKI